MTAPLCRFCGNPCQPSKSRYGWNNTCGSEECIRQSMSLYQPVKQTDESAFIGVDFGRHDITPNECGRLPMRPETHIQGRSSAA